MLRDIAELIDGHLPTTSGERGAAITTIQEMIGTGDKGWPSIDSVE